MSVSARMSLRDRAAQIERGRSAASAFTSAASNSSRAASSPKLDFRAAASSVGSERSPRAEDASELAAAKAEIERLKVTARPCSLSPVPDTLARRSPNCNESMRCRFAR